MPPDYPLWTAAVALTGATPVHYPCRVERDFVPDAAEVEALITPRTRALVLGGRSTPSPASIPRASRTVDGASLRAWSTPEGKHRRVDEGGG